MGLLDRLRHTRPDAPRRATALVLEADPGPAGEGTWPGALLLATQDGRHHRVDGTLDRDRWLLPGERVPVVLGADEAVDVLWAEVAPIADRAQAAGPPFGDPAAAVAEVAAVLAGAAPGLAPPAADPVPGLPEVLPDGRLRGHATPIAAAPSPTGRWEVWSVAVPGHTRRGLVAEVDAPTPAGGVEVGARPEAPHDVVVLSPAVAELEDVSPPPPAAWRASPPAAPVAPADHLAQLDALRASGVLPAAIADQMRLALEQQAGGGGG